MKKSVLILSVLMLLSSCSLDGFLFAPQTGEDYDFSNKIIPSDKMNLYEIKINDKRIYGLHVFHSPNSEDKILYFPGNYRNLNHYYKWIEIYWEMGYDVFAIDYEGFGKSEGKCSEDALLRDSEAAMDFVLTQLFWNQPDIIIYGYSLGSVPAVHISTKYKCKLLFLEAPIGNAGTIMEGSAPLDIPPQFVVVKKYDNIEKIKHTKNKVVIIQGDKDKTLPHEKNGKRVYENAPEPKKFVLIKDARHGDIPADMGRDNYKKLLFDSFGF